jgi:chemotaxis protein methyltransferase CheR
MRNLDEIRLEPDAFLQIRKLFNQHCGLSFGMEARPILERRLRERLGALGCESFSEYYDFLQFNDRAKAELDEAIDLVTVNETYFFREEHQLRAFRNDILPALVAPPARRDTLSVWSAGCSTGEEVYTIAISARESKSLEGRGIRIFGSDISRRCVAAARRGVYGESAFRATPPDMRRRYFVKRPNGNHVIDELRALCHFGYVNLLDAARAAIVGRVDVIFCRNVLIYLDEAARKRVIEMFYERLFPGGFLLLGHSESLLNVSTKFELVHLKDDLVYRKPMSTFRISPMGSGKGEGRG